MGRGIESSGPNCIWCLCISILRTSHKYHGLDWCLSHAKALLYLSVLVVYGGGAREKMLGVASAAKVVIVSGVRESKNFNGQSLLHWLKKLRKGHRYYECTDSALTFRCQWEAS